MDERSLREFDEVVATCSPELIPGFLGEMCEDFDLHDPSNRVLAERIAALIDSPSGDIRTTVVSNLCCYQRVPGFEHFVPRAWWSAPAGDLFPYAGAMRASFTKPADIIFSVLAPVVASLLKPPPVRDGFADELDYSIAVDNYRHDLLDSMSVIAHFQQLFKGRVPSLAKYYQDDCSPEELAEFKIDWQCVAEALFTVGRMHSE